MPNILAIASSSNDGGLAKDILTDDFSDMSNTLAITTDSNHGGMPKDALSSDQDLDQVHKSTPWWQRMGQTRRGSLGFSDTGIGSGTTPPACFYGTTPHSPMANAPTLPTVVEGRRTSFEGRRPSYVTSSTLARSHQDDASINLDASGRMFLEVDKMPPMPHYNSGDIYDLAEDEIYRKQGNVSGRGQAMRHSEDVSGRGQEKAHGDGKGQDEAVIYHSGDIVKKVKSEALTGTISAIESRKSMQVDNVTAGTYDRPDIVIEKDQHYASLALTPRHTPKHTLTPVHSRHTSGSPEPPQPEEELFEIEGTEDRNPRKDAPVSLVSGMISSVINSWFFTGSDRDNNDVEDECEEVNDDDKFRYRDGVQLVFNREEKEDTRRLSLVNQVKHLVKEDPQRLREMTHWAPQNQ